MKKTTILILLFLACFQINSQTMSYNINRSVNCSESLFEFEPNTLSYGISVSGNGQLLSDTSYIRIVLVDNQDIHWLIYERNTLYATEGDISFENAAFETSLLDGVFVKSIIAVVNNAVLNISTIKSNRTGPNGCTNIRALSDSIFVAKNLLIVDNINNISTTNFLNIKKRGALIRHFYLI